MTKAAATWKVRAVAAEAEVKRLRSLPVIETCRPCGHWRTETWQGVREVCHRGLPVYLDHAPPPGCPLRGKAGGR